MASPSRGSLCAGGAHAGNACSSIAQTASRPAVQPAQSDSSSHPLCAIRCASRGKRRSCPASSRKFKERRRGPFRRRLLHLRMRRSFRAQSRLTRPRIPANSHPLARPLAWFGIYRRDAISSTTRRELSSTAIRRGFSASLMRREPKRIRSGRDPCPPTRAQLRPHTAAICRPASSPSTSGFAPAMSTSSTSPSLCARASREPSRSLCPPAQPPARRVRRLRPLAARPPHPQLFAELFFRIEEHGDAAASPPGP